MIKEGALENPKPDVIFGLHATSAARTGSLAVRAGGALASSDQLRIVVHGRQTHGAAPWKGVDPIVSAAQILLGLQTIVSRQVDLTKGPAIISIGSIQGGVRGNIIPDSAVMVGTIRTFDPSVRDTIRARVRRTAAAIAQAGGATAEVSIPEDEANPVTWNDPVLTERMRATLRRVAGDSAVSEAPQITAAEDFSFYAQRVPGMFVFLGVTPRGHDPAAAPANHSPLFFADEAAFPIGVRAMAHLAADYLSGRSGLRP